MAFIDQQTPVVIICRDHGPFPQRPMNHLSSHAPSNCLGCAASTRRASLKAAWKEGAEPTRGATDNAA
ncbi:hypothetical protein [Curtobacterium flaccumfaciens]|uniref:hypothetical protein n=1 Tax=Curtobacterium flaccumfaciens TaxID=2035 RepID=UPI001BDE1A6A|nr:hypothetical protein [Curtobacterium flaccumfaciens]MBT1673413.1 hypothetical protein [Curtobacterium flaccumfaciens pv. flaccumfaciens]